MRRRRAVVAMARAAGAGALTAAAGRAAPVARAWDEW